MSEQVYDPVSGVRMEFEPDGDDLIVDLWLEPGGALPAHYHPKQEERWSVVEGVAGVRSGDEELVVRPEDGEIVVHHNGLHGITSVSDEVAHLRCRVIPALRIQRFLEESAAAAQEGMFTQRGLPRGLNGARWAASFVKRYRDETVFVSPPQFVRNLHVALLARE